MPGWCRIGIYYKSVELRSHKSRPEAVNPEWSDYLLALARRLLLTLVKPNLWVLKWQGT